MKLVPKLTLALVTVMCAVLAVNGYFRVTREIAYVEADRVRDHEMVGRALGAAVEAVWRSEGRTAALGVIAAANTHFSKLDVRWMETSDALSSCRDVWIDSGAFAGAPAGRPLTRRVQGTEAAHLHTCVPIDSGGLRQGAIQMRERLPNEEQPVRAAVRDASITAFAIASVSALLSLVLGVLLVGRPVNALVEKARRIGRGDFSGPVSVHQQDEFGVLAKEMNAMCSRLVSTLEQLRHADRLTTVGRLASGVAHELGTPLNVVSVRAEMIASGETTTEETKDYARVIAGASQRMTNIIRQLLEFARKGGAQKTQRDLQPLVKDSVHLLRPLSEKRRIVLVFEPPAGSVETIASVDPAQFEQVVTNLVMNAIQATRRAGTVKVSLSRESAAPPWHNEHGEYLCVRVHDEGDGIPEEHLPHIFEPFYTTKDVGEGTGLGLSVSYGIIQEHGGWIEVDTEIQRGSTFSVFLPHSEVR